MSAFKRELLLRPRNVILLRHFDRERAREAVANGERERALRAKAHARSRAG